MPTEAPEGPTKSESDCSRWHCEHDQWERDIRRWQADHRKALTDLEHIAQSVVNHGKALHRHEGDLASHKEALTAIERSGQSGTVSDSTMSGLARSHQQIAEFHERIRAHHNNAMALLKALVEALRTPM
ncbi:MAG: hypothetical protein J5J06_01020 [Phycisphaerae bacterium]|nr:hypothetical protein [Phycisphaerae bacterium]